MWLQLQLMSVLLVFMLLRRRLWLLLLRQL